MVILLCLIFVADKREIKRPSKLYRLRRAQPQKDFNIKLTTQIYENFNN